MNDRRRVIRGSVVVAVVALALALVAAGCGPKTQVGMKYHCPMHPTYVSDKPGDCPICGMRLVPIEAKTAPATAPAGSVPDHAPVTTTPEGRALAGIRTAVAAREKLDYEIRTVGTVTADETQVRHVHVKTAGYVEKLYVDVTGQLVKAGQPILSVYSPDLLANQEEYLRAREAEKKLAVSTAPEVRDGGRELVRAARRRLELLDVPASFIEELDRTGRPLRAVTLVAPATGYVSGKQVFEGHQIEPGMELFTVTDLSKVWIEAAVYESEARAVRLGQRADFAVPDDPGKGFSGKVVFVGPVVDPASRTLAVRFDFANPDLALKPGMFVDVVLRIESPEGVVVPDSAVLDTGARKIVFVEEKPGTFVPREVKVGVRSGGKVQVLSGVSAGESVAAQGNFLLDSESRLRAAIPSAGPAPEAR